MVPKKWTEEFWGNLAIRNLGQIIKITNFSNNPARINHFPEFSPIGAGMGIRRTSLVRYLEMIKKEGGSIQDRSGNKLSSSGDNEIVMQILLSGSEIGFFPELSLKHLIPRARVQKDYLARLNQGIMESWVGFLRKYEICPWQPITKRTLPIRKLKSYLVNKAWRGHCEYVRWRGYCGFFNALSK
ncbi:hypothetical protein D3C73_1202880 [compost metagenome]